MKKIIFASFIALLLVLFIVPQLQAQQTVNANSFKKYYQTPIVTNRAYLINTKDTIPNLVIDHWEQASLQSHELGGASMASLKIVSLDSIYIVVVVQELIGSTWTTILTDSLESTAATTKEFPIRSQNAESTAKLSGKFREIIHFVPWHTQGVSSATWTASWLWKP